MVSIRSTPEMNRWFEHSWISICLFMALVPSSGMIAAPPFNFLFGIAKQHCVLSSFSMSSLYLPAYHKSNDSRSGSCPCWGGSRWQGWCRTPSRRQARRSAPICFIWFFFSDRIRSKVFSNQKIKVEVKLYLQVVAFLKQVTMLIYQNLEKKGCLWQN